MNISVVVTVCNEQQSIAPLLESLLSQKKRPTEIIIVDGGSTDNTAGIIKQYQADHKTIKYFLDPGTISHGRNVAISHAKFHIIAQIDAGCIADEEWLSKITAPFEDPQVELVAGFYEMVSKTAFQKALAPFVGVVPRRYDPRSFLPSGRSVAFRKRIWEKVGGYSEKLERAGEDTFFNYLVVKEGISIYREKNALVKWQVPENVKVAAYKFYSYSYGDAQANIWWHPSQKLSTHNIKITFLFARYVFGLILFNLSFFVPYAALLLVTGFILYTFASVWKMRDVVTSLRAKLWLPVIQVVSDLSVMAGFLAGTIRRV